MNGMKWCAFISAVLGPSIQDSVALAQHRLTSTWKMLSASEMGTFSEPKLGDFAIVRVLVVFAQAIIPVLIGVYSRECLLTDGAAEHNVGRRKPKARALLTN